MNEIKLKPCPFCGDRVKIVTGLLKENEKFQIEEFIQRR